MATLVPRGEKNAASASGLVVKGSTVFNAVVVACFRHVPSSLQQHFPQASSKPSLPSSQRPWTRVRRTVKQYLFDLIQLTETLQDKDMQQTVLKQVHAMAIFFVCFPKILKVINKCLIEKWSAADSHVQVLAFLAMRRLVLLQPHPALHVLLKVQLPMVKNFHLREKCHYLL